MTLSRRALSVAVLSVVLGGCSFRPLYGTAGKGHGAVDLSYVSVDEQPNRPGQLVRNELLRVMTGDGSRYALKMTVADRDRSKSSLPGTGTARLDLTLTAEYQLIDTRSGEKVNSGKSFSTVSFDTVRQPVADLQARDAAMERASIELANDVRTRVAVYFSKVRKSP